jgi:hypothetical protein
MMSESNELTPIETEDHEPVIRFDAPETLLIECVRDEKSNWGGLHVNYVTVMDGPDDCMGAAGFAISYYGLFEYVVMDLIEPPGEGWYVINDCTGSFSRGDGWTTDDDTEYYFGDIRPATRDEIQNA